MWKVSVQPLTTGAGPPAVSIASSCRFADAAPAASAAARSGGQPG
jgi:hypothetical protein